MGKVRIATLRDGRRYLVQQLDFKYDRVHCWGEALALRARKVVHDKSVTFELAAVKIAEVDLTGALQRELVNQGASARAARAAGSQVAVDALNETLRESLSDPLSRKLLGLAVDVARGAP